MRRTRQAVRGATLLVLGALALAACRDARPPAAAAVPQAASAAPRPSAAEVGYHLVVSAPGGNGAPGWRLSVEAEAAPDADGILRVRAIDVLREGSDRPVQRIDGLDTRTPWSAEAPGVEFVDMNFDGHVDLRLIESRPAGPNVPYRNWLFDPDSQRFVESPALDEVASPSFDAEHRVVRSQWRDGAARYGTDTFAWQEGRLVPQLREVHEASTPGAFSIRTYAWDGSDWKPKRDGRKP
jgi:hypothetical protein